MANGIKNNMLEFIKPLSAHHNEYNIKDSSLQIMLHVHSASGLFIILDNSS